MIFNKLPHLKEPLKSSWINQSQVLWWLEIKTSQPYCIYYFGPFASPQEARLHQAGYVKELVEEQAEEITIKLKKCQPKELTICSDSELD